MALYQIISQSPAGRTFTTVMSSNYPQTVEIFSELCEIYPNHIHALYEEISGERRAILVHSSDN